MAAKKATSAPKKPMNRAQLTELVAKELGESKAGADLSGVTQSGGQIRSVPPHHDPVRRDPTRRCRFQIAYRNVTGTVGNPVGDVHDADLVVVVEIGHQFGERHAAQVGAR